MVCKLLMKNTRKITTTSTTTTTTSTSISYCYHHYSTNTYVGALYRYASLNDGDTFRENASLGDFVVVRTSQSGFTQTQIVQCSLLHTQAIWYNLLLLGYKSVHHVKKVKISRNRPGQAQGVPGRLRPRIFLTFRTTRVVGRQPYAPVAFTPGEMLGTNFQKLCRPQGTWFLRQLRKKSPVTPPVIDPKTVRLVARCFNHYATPGRK